MPSLRLHRPLLLLLLVQTVWRDRLQPSRRSVYVSLFDLSSCFLITCFLLSLLLTRLICAPLSHVGIDCSRVTHAVTRWLSGTRFGTRCEYIVFYFSLSFYSYHTFSTSFNNILSCLCSFVCVCVSVSSKYV